MRSSILAALAIVIVPATARAEPRLVFSVENGPEETAHDVVFLAEGFKAGEEKAFEDRARAFVEALTTDAASPVRRDPKGFNFHAVFEVSKERASTKGTAKNTAFRARVLDNGLIAADDAASDAAALVAPDVDVTVLVCNHGFTFSAPRASADYPPFGARVRIPDGEVDVLVHELGHALYGLGDEYQDLGGAIPENEKPWIAYFANLTTDPSGARFTGLGVTKLFEGGAHYDKGVWRTEKSCRMRDSRTRDAGFCVACRALIENRPTAPPSPPAVTLTEEPSGTVLRVTPSGPVHFYDVSVMGDGAELQRLTLEGGKAIARLGVLPPGARVVVRPKNVAGTGESAAADVGASQPSAPPPAGAGPRSRTRGLVGGLGD